MGACGLVEGQPVLEVPLVRFVGVDDDAEEHERNQLRVLQGEGDDGLFGFENAFDVVGRRHRRWCAARAGSLRAQPLAPHALCEACQF